MRSKFIDNLTIGTKVVWSVAFTVFFGFGSLIAIVGFNIFDNARTAGYKQVREQSEAYAHEISNFFAVNFMPPLLMARAVQGMKNQGLPSRKMTDAMIMSMLENVPAASGLWMIWEANAFDGKDSEYRKDWPTHDPTGRYIPYMTRSESGIKHDTLLDSEQLHYAEAFREDATNYKPPYDQPGWGDFYRLAKERAKNTVTEPFPYEVQGQATLLSSLEAVMTGSTGKVLGVAGVDIPLKSLQALVSTYKPFSTGFVTLISNGGLYVVAQNPELIGKQYDKAVLSSALFENISQGRVEQMMHDNSFLVWRAIKVGDTGQNWVMGVSVPLDAILASAIQARNQTLLLGGLFIVSILLILSALLKVQTQPLRHLAELMEELASGDRDLTRRLPVNSKDEIGVISEAFNRFVLQLQNMLIQLYSQSEALQHSAISLSQSTAKIEQATSAQANAVTIIGSSAEQLKNSIQHIADSAKHQQQITRTTTATMTDSLTLALEAASKNDNANICVNELAQTMSKLGEQSQQIDMIVSVIKSIADQTNLLALNAAIEAARAGEFGRGFAVVSDEVRTLALRTTDATVEIDNIVNIIQKEILNANTRVGNTRNAINESFECSQQAAESIKLVNCGTQDLISQVVNIAHATDEQAGASTEIVLNIDKISGLAHTNQETVTEFCTSVRNLEDLANTMRTIVQRYKF